MSTTIRRPLPTVGAPHPRRPPVIRPGQNDVTGWEVWAAGDGGGGGVSSVDRCGGDAPAYVLRALEDHELDAFRPHLARCVVCGDECGTLQAVADALAMAAPQLPTPRRLRRRVLRDGGADGTDAYARPRRTRIALSDRYAPAPRPGFAVATAVIAVVGLGGLGLSQAGRARTTTRTVEASVVGSDGHARLTLAADRAELLVRDLPAPPAGKLYQVWLRRGDRPPASTGSLFSVTAAGAGSADVPGDLHGVSQVMVTAEPAGGSAVPTAAPVIVAQLN
jgi:anti-sigma-K factor RskA